MILRLITVVITLMATYWYGLTRSWEAFFTAAGFFIAYLGTETYGRFRTEGKRVADCALFRTLQTELPFDPTIRFLREHDFGADFRWSEVKPVGRFGDDWVDEDHKFHDKSIERAKEEVRAACLTLISEISHNTFPQGSDGEFQSVPKEWQGKQEERYKEVTTRLNRLADEVVAKHQELVKLARKRLNL